MKGELDIPCKVSVSTLGTFINLILLESYKELYLEVKEEVILGSVFVPKQASQVLDTSKKNKQKKTKGKPQRHVTLDGILEFNK